MEAEEFTQYVIEELESQRYAIVELARQFVPQTWTEEDFAEWCLRHGWEVDVIKEPTEDDVTDAIARILNEGDTQQ